MKTDRNESSKIIVPLGNALKDARLNASLSIEEVADQLNLSFTTVRDIEDSLVQIQETKKYPIIYLRGYLVNYARLVALDTLEEFAEFQQLTSAQKSKKKLASSSLIIPRDKKHSKVLPFSLLLLICVAIVFYFFQSVFFSPTKKTSSMSEITAPLSDTSSSQRLEVKKTVVIKALNKDSEAIMKSNVTLDPIQFNLPIVEISDAEK